MGKGSQGYSVWLDEFRFVENIRAERLKMFTLNIVSPPPTKRFLGVSQDGYTSDLTPGPIIDKSTGTASIHGDKRQWLLNSSVNGAPEIVSAAWGSFLRQLL
ncbi:MAG: hypothetical protein AAGC93_25825 [Cyanobacteria bacterium P01_F01_bin.53]